MSKTNLAIGVTEDPESYEVEVSQLTSAEAQDWDDFVERAPSATFFHLSGWSTVMSSVLRHKTYYLYAKRGGRITGVLPLAEIRSRLFGHSLISTPFCVYGGPVGETDRDREALVERAKTLAEQLRVEYLELKNIEPCPGDWRGKSLYVTFRKEISTDEDENLRSVPRKQRAMIRKGMKNGLQSHVSREVGPFYSMYSASVRNLGTPVLGQAYFQALLDVFGDRVDILTVTHEGQPLSSVLSFYFRNEVLPYYGGGVSEARRFAANDFMYWELMCHALKRNATVFDFGRSKIDTGSYRFKTHWGFEPEALNYQYHLVTAADVPNLSPTNPKYRLFIAAWKRLPIPLSRAIGPLLARNLG